MIRAVAALAVLGAALPAAAQEAAPASAIPWLSDTIRDRPVPRPRTEEGTSTPTETAIVTSSLDAPRRDAVGLLPPSLSGIPRDAWAGADAEAVRAAIAAIPATGPHAMRALVLRLLVAETDPPVGAAPDATFLARVDALLALGALDRAQALLERAGPTDPETFRRWFDAGLLTGVDARACEAMGAHPELSPTLPARIFCLTRTGDWVAAALALDTAAALDLVDPEEELLVARFLDPELFEGEPSPPVPDPLTPLAYRLLDGIGEAPDTRALPLAFANADLRMEVGWKAQIEAAERLVRAGALDAERLWGLYAERRPSASGGVWERAAAVQRLDAAVLTGDAGTVAAALPRAVAEMERARLLVPFAARYGPRLARLDLPRAAAQQAARLGLLSRAPGDHADAPALLPNERLARAVARDAPIDPPPGLLLAAVAEGLWGAPVAPEGGVGLAILRAATALADGGEAPPGAVEAALKALRGAGLEADAKRLALELLLA